MTIFLCTFDNFDLTILIKNEDEFAILPEIQPELGSESFQIIGDKPYWVEQL